MIKELTYLALLIYDECISWITDYIENEITFDEVINGYEETTAKFFYKDHDLYDYLNELQIGTLTCITDILEEKITVIHDKDSTSTISEEEVIKQLINIIDKKYH